MIRMVKAEDLQLGMTISTDGLIVGNLRYIHHGPYPRVEVGGMCHGIWKRAIFRSDDELPIYYDDSNSGED